MERLRNSTDIQTIVEKALGPEVWLEHLEQDLMKVWDREDAYKVEEWELFPTY